MSFRFLTAGESHGKALVGILEGLPSGLDISTEAIHAELKRRKLGYGRGARQKIEDDAVEILSGVRFGKTFGAPVALLIWNKDFQAWQDVMRVDGPEPAAADVRRKVEIPRPGHADVIGGFKYAHSDMRNVLERSSARETAMRVAIGTLARRFLQALDIHVGSRVVRIGSEADSNVCAIAARELNAGVDASPVRCADPDAEARMIKIIETAKKEGNTLGGVIEVVAEGVPMGVGSYVQWDRRLEASIGEAFLSMNAFKGVEIGMGFGTAAAPGTEVHDEFFPAPPSAKTHQRYTYRTNRSGGIDGGMSTGQPIVVRAAMKPLATLMSPLLSVNLATGEAAKAHVERSDVCAVPAAAVIGESLLALCLAEAILDQFGGDSMPEICARVSESKRREPRA